MKHLIALISLLTVTGCAMAAGKESRHYKQIDLDGGQVCVNAVLPVTVRQIAGMFGTSLGGSKQGASVLYPLINAQSDAVGGTLGVFIKPRRGPQAPLPEINDSQGKTIEGLPGLIAMPKNPGPMRIQLIAGPDTKSAIGRFVATCDDLPTTVQLCSRRFDFEGLTGAYSFKRGEVQGWENMEATLERMLTSKDVTLCSQ